MIGKSLRKRRRRWRQWKASGERRRRKTRRNHQVRRGKWVRRFARGVEQVGLVGRKIWDIKRKKSVKK